MCSSGFGAQADEALHQTDQARLDQDRGRQTADRQKMPPNRTLAVHGLRSAVGGEAPRRCEPAAQHADANKRQP